MTSARATDSSRLAWGVTFGLISVFVAVAAAFVSRLEWRPGGVVVPWGLLLAVAGSGASVVLGRSVGRSVGLAAAAGWLVGVGIVVLGRPEGDYLIAADYLGYGFLLGATAVVIVTAGYGGSLR